MFMCGCEDKEGMAETEAAAPAVHELTVLPCGSRERRLYMLLTGLVFRVLFTGFQ